MKVNVSPLLSTDAATTRFFKSIAQQVNLLSEGKSAAHYQALTAAPTTGTHAQGDEIKNSTPTELGSAASKYVVRGWICVAGGTPGTWLELRNLTGN